MQQQQVQQQQWAADSARRASDYGRDAHRGFAQGSVRRGSSGRLAGLVQLVLLIAAVVYLAGHPDVRAALWGFAQHAWSHLNSLIDDARSGN
ncbi:hypothetical protein ACIBL5_23345 [Streptomyces sp. NPDC050516]|uniref:hypothetical protein n=1 Tax=Streptomyces sp. NPDC050516 TaxID=3365621 RepID=UPI0037B4CB95